MNENNTIQLSKSDWYLAIYLATGLNKQQVNQCLRLAGDLDYDKDGENQCKLAVLHYGPQIIAGNNQDKPPIAL